MKRFLSQLPVFEPGWVWLVGAGPGDPGLLSLHAANAINQADVIVYDALVNNEILALVADQSRLIYAGKRGGKPSEKQGDISLKVVELARQDKRVCRLKGGDPFVFGRGGEEALTLVEHDINFRIIPGISAGIGGLAYAGIPLTHRDINQSATFITGHDANGILPTAIDWQAISQGSGVIVIYMAVKHWAGIRRNLLHYGRRKEEAVAFVSNATLTDQIVLETTLDRSINDLEKSDIKPPAIVVVGDVVRLRDGLDWQGALTGKKLTRNPLENTLIENTLKSDLL